MRSVCLPHTSLPGTSALFVDYLYHFDRVERFYSRSPHDPEELRRAAADAARLPDERRAALVAALRSINGDSSTLDLLELPDTVAVVTGQQVGLFSGPAYTIYKALSAAKLARQLTDSGTRAVPVFWLATEDHDFAEIDHAHVFGPSHQPVNLVATGSGVNGQPVGGVAMRDIPLDALRSALDGFLYADEILTMVEETYRPGRSFGEAFRLLVKKILAGYGLVFLDPLDPGIRKLSAPFMRQALDAAPELGAALRARSKDLQNSGYHAQVLFEEQSSFFFLLENGRRLPLRFHDGNYFQEHRRIEPAALKEVAEHLSPNALLRPVLQDYLLPTAAYIGGPAELAYLAQSNVLYQGLLGHAPVALPRSGFTLLDERASALLKKYSLTVPDAFAGEDALRQKIAGRLIPPSLESSFSEVTAGATTLLEGLHGELERFDSTLAAALLKSRAKILYQLDKTRAKAAREALRRNGQVAAGASHLSGLLFPERHLQERYYSLLPFLAKYGLDLVDTLYEHVDRACPDHLLLTV